MNSAWRNVMLADIVEPVTKRDPATTGRLTFRYIDIGSIDATRHKVVEAIEIPSTNAPGRARQHVRANDTLFSTVRPYLEKIAYVDPSLDGEIASTGFCVLRPSASQLEPRYLFHYMTSKQLLDQVLPLQRGVSYPAVRDRDVLTATIPLPAVDEQRRIVETLEDHLSRLEAANDYLTRVTGRARVAAQSSAMTMVRAAEAKKGTTVVPLASLARIGSGTTPKRGQASYWRGGTIPWVTSGELAQGLIGATAQCVTDAALKETALKLWPAGTLLVAMYGEGRTRGTVGELGIAATTNQACAAIELHENNEITRAWTRLVLGARYETMRRSSSGGVQPNLTLGYFKAMTVPWPSTTTMRAMIAAQGELSNELEQVRSAAATAERRSNSLRQSLMAAAFSGQLTSQRPDVDMRQVQAPA